MHGCMQRRLYMRRRMAVKQISTDLFRRNGHGESDGELAHGEARGEFDLP